MRKHILTIALTIAGLTLGTAYAAPASNATQDIHTVRGTLIGHDSDGHRTLNEVALGVPLDDAMPACEGDPHKATSLCHTPLTRPYDGAKELKSDVYGFGVRKDDEGHPKVTSMVVTTSISSTVIKDVTAHIASASTYKTFLETSQVLGIPTLMEDDFTGWDPGRGPVVLLGTSFITLYQR
ncbi:hypothetical protein [Burkholderia stabilis]|uniref:hypothetical protein n=1 Tax=Burkholderia stabilis TaxID=95485 RepID=UPI0012EA811B|nr:hypothetical protein [Burkholderia stabilis]HDR9491916.1 hypothetical protein [Burkholderia stabilis]HDR9524050.1 hypothetical protein [Burkholderia stabilis]HDR9530643.1 hypothetical protein [Burkholderia stabilis]HDR9539373.1 hypothetical protein [Burkholderia stabilis]HDR9547305.1 hypothetical protein [Burkholderia stabilis]